MKAQDIINYYYKFIDTMGLNERNPEFKITDIIDWFADVMKVDSSDKYVNMISVMFGKAWANEGLCNRYDDENFEAVMFEDDDYSEFGNDGVDFSYKGKHDVADLDDDYLRDYGNRGVRFSSIDSKFAEGKTIKKTFGKRVMKESSDKIDFKTFLHQNTKLPSIRKAENVSDRFIKEVGNFIKSYCLNKEFLDKYDNASEEEKDRLILDTVYDNLFEWIKDKKAYQWEIIKSYYNNMPTNESSSLSQIFYSAFTDCVADIIKAVKDYLNYNY